MLIKIFVKILDPFDKSKEALYLIKELNIVLPTKDQLDFKNQSKESKLQCVMLLDRNHTWLLMPDKKLRKFNKEMDNYYLERLGYLPSKERNDIKKAFKKAYKLKEKSSDNLNKQNRK